MTATAPSEPSALTLDVLVIGWGKGSKTLVHDAAQRHEGEDPQQFWDRAVARRDTVAGAMRAVNRQMLAGLDAVTPIDGCARFIGEKAVLVAGGPDRLLVTAPVSMSTNTVP